MQESVKLSNFVTKGCIRAMQNLRHVLSLIDGYFVRDMVTRLIN